MDVHEEAVLCSVAGSLLLDVLVINVGGGEAAEETDNKRSDNHSHGYHLPTAVISGGGVQRQIHYTRFSSHLQIFPGILDKRLSICYTNIQLVCDLVHLRVSTVTEVDRRVGVVSTLSNCMD